jgi:hypothetical protein
MSPSKYEIPSGSTYGYLIADNAAKVEIHQSILFPITPPVFLRSETIRVQSIFELFFDLTYFLRVRSRRCRGMDGSN